MSDLHARQLVLLEGDILLAASIRKLRDEAKEVTLTSIDIAFAVTVDVAAHCDIELRAVEGRDEELTCEGELGNPVSTARILPIPLEPIRKGHADCA